jgi:hypothetical protein
VPPPPASDPVPDPLPLSPPDPVDAPAGELAPDPVPDSLAGLLPPVADDSPPGLELLPPLHPASIVASSSAKSQFERRA